MQIPDNTPVLVGIGTATQREDDFQRALEPMDLMHAAVAAAGRDLTVTGGMAFAGGPYNNYMLQSTCRVAEQLRAARGRIALVSGVSGVLTKQGFGLWSVDPPARGFQHADVSSATARDMPVREVLEHYTGTATVAGYTVLHGRAQRPRAVALFDTPHGQRALATSEEPAWVARMQEEEWVGRAARVDADKIAPIL